jgi:hypothetical protein
MHHYLCWTSIRVVVVLKEFPIRARIFSPEMACRPPKNPPEARLFIRQKPLSFGAV